MRREAPSPFIAAAVTVLLALILPCSSSSSLAPRPLLLVACSRLATTSEGRRPLAPVERSLQRSSAFAANFDGSSQPLHFDT